MEVKLYGTEYNFMVVGHIAGQMGFYDGDVFKIIKDIVEDWETNCEPNRPKYISGFANQRLRELMEAKKQDTAIWNWMDDKPHCPACDIEPYRESNNKMPNYCPSCGIKVLHSRSCTT
jgi:hypothetical protein